MFTVQNLLDKIKQEKISTSLPIGTLGHYGEIFYLDKFDFEILVGLDCANDKKRRIFQIKSPDIGPEPD